MNQTYLTTDQLAEIIHYDSRTIRTRLKDACWRASRTDPLLAVVRE